MLVTVSEGESKKVAFSLQAMRALAGSVKIYDPAKGAYIPLARVRVQLAELNLVITTDMDGHYLFRSLPSGIFTIRVDGQECGRVQISEAPQLLRHDILVKPLSIAKITDNNSTQ